MDIRFANKADLEIVRKVDPHSVYIDREKILCKILQQEILLAESGGIVIGIIKFSYLWATRPFLELIYLLPEWRGKKLSRPFLKYLEDYLIKNEYNYLFSSAEKADSYACKWHVINGFTECGQINNLNVPHDTTPELFFYKRISIGDIKEDKLKQYSL